MYPIPLMPEVADWHDVVYRRALVGILDHVLAGRWLSLDSGCTTDDAAPYRNQACEDYIRLVKRFLEVECLLKATPEMLLRLAEEERDQCKALRKKPGGKNLSCCRKFVGKIFDYQNFTANVHQVLRPGRSSGRWYVGQTANELMWGAWLYMRRTHLHYCPYCNSADIYAIKKSDGKKIRSSLDHYFSKEHFPFMQLSLYNLIPSCAECNSGIKGTKEVLGFALPHPYEKGDSVHDLIRFGFDASASENFVGAFRNSRFRLKAEPRTGLQSARQRKAEEFLKFFQTNEVYSKFSRESEIAYLMQDIDDLNSEYLPDVIAKVGKESVVKQIKKRLKCQMNPALINYSRHEKLKIDFAERYLRIFGKAN